MTTRCKICGTKFPYITFGGNSDDEIEYQERNYVCSQCWKKTNGEGII